MRGFEISSSGSYGPIETDPGPPPVTTEELNALLDHIKAQWVMRTEGMTSRSADLIESTRSELYRAYGELAKLREFLSDPEAVRYIDAPTLEDAKYELWLYCVNLARMLK